MIGVVLSLVAARPDWLVNPEPYKARAFKEGNRVVLDNGFARREIVTTPNAATVSLKNLATDEELIRAVKPEATITVDGKAIDVGGLVGQPDLAFLLPQWLESMTPDPAALRFDRVVFGHTHAPFDYKPSGHFARREWPPHGASATLEFTGHNLKVQVHFEIYDGIPLIGKWLTITNAGNGNRTIDAYRSEILGLVEGESAVGVQRTWRKPNVTAFTDYAFGGDNEADAQPAIAWLPDPHYSTIVNYNRVQPVDLVSSPPIGPGVTLESGQSLTTHRTYLLLQDSSDHERSGLALRRAYRSLAPWALENPIMLHLTSVEPAVVHRAMDQAAECGFELVIFSFGSGLDMENVSAANIAKFKAYADYAHRKGLMVGGYSLLASRHIDDANDVINPKTGKPGGAIFGFSPCLCSEWGIRYFAHIKKFLADTGFDLLEHDGSYPGDPCASTTHPGHRGLADSQWMQFKMITDFYHWCRGRGIFLNVPDWYFLEGSNKSGMGYRETNWSLPRDLQVIHARQNMYDGTWGKTPSMGWMFVPLVQYQGGGEAATIEPLKDHLKVYEQHLMNCFGFGVQACYRGPRLFDAPETEAMVKRCVTWFKAHREILESDVIHLRRADGRDWDGILHVNPALTTPALAMLYNPLDEPIKRKIRIPLYYAGLRGEIQVQLGTAAPHKLQLDASQVATVTVSLAAGGNQSVSFSK
ncbi:MAG: alpha-galactosidase [Fimbriimonadaceae bacterium]